MAEKRPKKARTPGTARRRRKRAGVSAGLAASELQAEFPAEIAELRRAIDRDGGRVLTAYREPYGGRWLLLAAVPIEQVEPTPYQRNLSNAHVRKLEAVIHKIGRFLDPIIAVRVVESDEGPVRYWTPNGLHHLCAMRTLGARSITAIIVPEMAAAYQILALNTEKAHTLRERALEVIRMYRDLARLGDGGEQQYALEFEEAALITLGLCYEGRPRFAGGAYQSILRRVDEFFPKPLHTAMEVRQARAEALLRIDDVVGRHVEALKARGLTSPYLRNFVVARINPLRFRPKEAEPLSFDEALGRMEKAAASFKPDRVKMEDLARSGGTADGETE